MPSKTKSNGISTPENYEQKPPKLIDKDVFATMMYGYKALKKKRQERTNPSQPYSLVEHKKAAAPIIRQTVPMTPASNKASPKTPDNMEISPVPQKLDCSLSTIDPAVKKQVERDIAMLGWQSP
jgi:hypothetical protein